MDTIPACHWLHHGTNIQESQYKRECILRTYLKRVPYSRNWVISTEQDTFFRMSTIWNFLHPLGHTNRPYYLKPVIGAFFIFSHSCLRASFNDSSYISCKKDFLSKPSSRKGKYRHALYNNDHLIEQCFVLGCHCYKADRHAHILIVDYNFAGQNETRKSHVHHHTLPGNPTIRNKTITVDKPHTRPFRVKYVF